MASRIGFASIRATLPTAGEARKELKALQTVKVRKAGLAPAPSVRLCWRVAELL
jgi:hypothetical protein